MWDTRTRAISVIQQVKTRSTFYLSGQRSAELLSRGRASSAMQGSTWSGAPPWSSHDSIDTMARHLVGCFELLWADASEMAKTSRAIVERHDVRIRTLMRADPIVRPPGRPPPSVARSLEARADRHAASELAPAPRVDPCRVLHLSPHLALVPPARTPPAARSEAARSHPPSDARSSTAVRRAPPSLSRTPARLPPTVRRASIPRRSRCARIRRTIASSVMNARIRVASPQAGHTSTSTWWTRRRSSA